MGFYNDNEPNYKFITATKHKQDEFSTDLYFSLVFNTCCSTSICKVLNCSMFDLLNLDISTFLKIQEKIRAMDAKEEETMESIKKDTDLNI